LKGLFDVRRGKFFEKRRRVALYLREHSFDLVTSLAAFFQDDRIKVPAHGDISDICLERLTTPPIRINNTLFPRNEEPFNIKLGNVMMPISPYLSPLFKLNSNQLSYYHFSSLTTYSSALIFDQLGHQAVTYCVRRGILQSHSQQTDMSYAIFNMKSVQIKG
jgi:hypothetical protein